RQIPFSRGPRTGVCRFGATANRSVFADFSGFSSRLARSGELAWRLLSTGCLQGYWSRHEPETENGVCVMNKFLNSFLRDESGVTAMEYGMIAALIAVVIVTTLGLVGDDLKTTFDTIESKIAEANAKAG